jgi:hypothetical protein
VIIFHLATLYFASLDFEHFDLNDHKNGFCILMDIVIVDLIYINIVQWTSMTIAHVATMAIQEKTQSYIERTLNNDFIPLVIDMCGCLHSHFDCLCINDYHKSLTTFLSPLNVHFELSTMCVHNLATCIAIL